MPNSSLDLEPTFFHQRLSALGLTFSVFCRSASSGSILNSLVAHFSNRAPPIASSTNEPGSNRTIPLGHVVRLSRPLDLRKHLLWPLISGLISRSFATAASTAVAPVGVAIHCYGRHLARARHHLCARATGPRREPAGLTATSSPRCSPPRSNNQHCRCPFSFSDGCCDCSDGSRSYACFARSALDAVSSWRRLVCSSPPVIGIRERPPWPYVATWAWETSRAPYPFEGMAR